MFNHIGWSEDKLTESAIATGWLTRPPRKIEIIDLLSAVCTESIQGLTSYNDVASRIDADSGKNPSRQAVAKRMNKGLSLLLEKILEQAIEHKVSSKYPQPAQGLCANYKRILVQDSTVIKLPTWLYEKFSGVSNAHGKSCNARIQATYDIANMTFISFSIDTYSKNDLAAAPELEILEGDLTLRDRGYLSSEEISRQIKIGADTIYRHKTNTVYLDIKTGKPINLAALLKKHGCLDQDVMLNDRMKTTVRLVAAPVNEEIVNIRRMKAKKEAHGHNPSDAVLALMGWTIFLTNIPRDKSSFEKILAIYGLRWRIEIIFKAWKSHVNFSALHRVSQTQLYILLKARLLMITVMTNLLYKRCYEKLKHCHGTELSLLKFINYLIRKSHQIAIILSSLSNNKCQVSRIWDSLEKYCCYDKRKRKNYHELFCALALS